MSPLSPNEQPLILACESRHFDSANHLPARRLLLKPLLQCTIAETRVSIRILSANNHDCVVLICLDYPLRAGRSHVHHQQNLILSPRILLQVCDSVSLHSVQYPHRYWLVCLSPAETLRFIRRSIYVQYPFSPAISIASVPSWEIM